MKSIFPFDIEPDELGFLDFPAWEIEEDEIFEEIKQKIDKMCDPADSWEEKLRKMAKVTKMYKIKREVLTAEAKRLKAIAFQIELRDAILRELIAGEMESLGQEFIDFGIASISLMKGRESVVVTEEELPPTCFEYVKKVIPKKDIAKWLKAGEKIPGAEIVRGNCYVTIK